MRFNAASPKLRWMLALSAAISLLPAVASAVTISTPVANNTSVGRYDRYELTFNLSNVSPSDYNPFRPDTTSDSLSPAGVDVWAEVTTPSGAVKKVWGYWDIDYAYLGNSTKATQELHDRFVPVSDPHWHIRYAPMDLGTYKVVVKAKDQSGTAVSSQLTFTCVESSLKGFIKPSADGTRLVYSDGSPYVQFGTMAPYGTQYASAGLDAMKANGMTFMRKWLVNRDLDDIHRDFEGWASYSSDTATYRSGKRSAVKSVTGAATIVDQSFIGCKPNTYYKAFAYIKTSSSFNGTAAVTVNEDSGSSTVTRTGNSVGSNQNWTLSQVVFKTGSAAQMLHFKPKVLSGSAGTVWVDDVGLYECDSAGNITVNSNMVANPGFEQWTPARLRMIPLARLEYLLQKAEDCGVAIQPCIFDYRLWNSSNPTGFYAQFFGDWWTDAASQAQQDRVLRYLVARFSTYRSLFGWELANEMDSSYTDVRANWINTRANYIESGDPVGHVITNSYWGSPADYRLGQLGSMDVNQVHYYIDTEEYNHGRGYPAWWTLPSGMVVDTNSANAASGSYSLKITANGSTISRAAGIYCKPSRSFTLSYKVKTSGVTGQASVILNFYGGSSPGSSITLNNTGTAGYTQRTQGFTTGSTCTNFNVTVQLTGSAGTAWFDDFQITDNVTGRQVLPDGGFESPLLGDDEFDWAVYNTVNTDQRYTGGPNGVDKPWVSGESGLMGADYNMSLWAKYGDTTKPRHDSNGLHLHNEIWAQLAVSGGINTPNYWWVDEYVRAWNLYGVWKGATTFATKLPFFGKQQGVSTDPCISDVKVTVTDSKLRIAGQKKDTSGYFYIQNKQNTWSRVIRDGLTPTPATGTISIPGFSNGTYTLNWYNTSTGQISQTETQNVSNGVLSLSISSLTSDTAVIVQGSGASASQPQISISLTVDKTKAVPGDAMTYTVSYTNKGNGDAANVIIKLPIPVNTTYVSGSASTGGTYDAATNTVQWIVPAVAVGASGQCTAKVMVN